MFKKLLDHLSAKYTRRDQLSRQLEIVKVFDIYRQELKKFFPEEQMTKPISLKNQILTVATSSAVMATELRLREGAILEKINRVLGKKLVRRVSYRF